MRQSEAEKVVGIELDTEKLRAWPVGDYYDSNKLRPADPSLSLLEY